MSFAKVKIWLENKFYKDNHKKYHKYCKEWLDNLLPYQLKGFEKQMYNDENNILRWD
jgi:hypothetical protein